MVGSWFGADEKKLLRRASEACGISMSSFIRRSTLSEIKRLISDDGDLADEEQLKDDLRDVLTQEEEESDE